MNMTGIGYDVHRFVENRPLILGGVEIPHTYGLDGHSDADVLTHAIADAVLGAIGERDIGHHFPNHDESIRGIRSLEILRKAGELVKERGGRVVNIDATLIAEAPKIGPHVAEMRENFQRPAPTTDTSAGSSNLGEWARVLRVGGPEHAYSGD